MGTRYTVLCPCGFCLRGITLLLATQALGNHRNAQLIPDDTYDRLLADVFDAATAALAQ